MIEMDFSLSVGSAILSDCYLVGGAGAEANCEPRLFRDHASHSSYGVSSCVSRGDCRSRHGDTVRCSGVQCLPGDSAPPIRPYTQTKGRLVSYHPLSAQLKPLIALQVYVWSSSDH